MRAHGRGAAMRCVVALALLTIAGGSYGADLVSAWQSARGHDAVYAAARAQWQAGLTRDRQARSLLMPQVAATGSAGYGIADRDTRGAQFSAPGFGASNDASFRTRVDGGTATSWAVTAQQSLYNVERSASSRQLEREARLADAQFQLATQQLILRTAQAYFDVVVTEETLATLRAQKAEAARALDVAREKFDAGAIPVTDRDEAQSRYDDIRSREIAAASDVELKRQLYADLTGTPAQHLSRVAPERRNNVPAIAPLAEWLRRAEERSPLIAMQGLGVDIAREEVAKYRALVSPSLDLVARLGEDRMQGPSGYGPHAAVTSSMRLVGLQITIPLYTGGMRSAKRDEAAALAERARHDETALREEVLRNTHAAWLAVTTGIERVAALEQASRSSRSRRNATETGQEVGARTMQDVLNAQSDYFQAQRNLLQARYQLLLDRLRLAALAGELGEREVSEINAFLSSS